MMTEVKKKLHKVLALQIVSLISSLDPYFVRAGFLIWRMSETGIKISATHKLITITVRSGSQVGEFAKRSDQEKVSTEANDDHDDLDAKKCHLLGWAWIFFRTIFHHSFSVGPAVIDGTCNEETFIRNSFVFPCLFTSTGDLKIQ